MSYNNVSGIIVVLILIIVLVVSLVLANKRIDNRKNPNDLFKFSAPVRWDPYPDGDTVEVDNKFDCNVHTLRTCSIDDPTTLLGCREFAVRCHHFDTDRKHYSNGNETIIPKNKSPNEGYALAITSLADECNVYHGDLVLIDKNPTNNEYMLVCNCKDPGYIGNDNILGPCTSVFICNGKIDNIDKPLNEINCVCDNHETNVRYDDGVPVCKTMLVHEANKKFDDWSHLVPWSSSRLLDIQKFNPTVRDNLKVTQLLDPCRNAIDDPTTEILHGLYSDKLKSCTFTNYGLPVRVGILPSVSEKEPVPYTTVDAALPTDRHKSVRFADNIAGQRLLMNVHTRLNAYKYAIPEVYVNLPKNVGFGENSQFHINARKQMIAGRCESDWPYYSCSLNEHFLGTFNGVPYPAYNLPPFGFLWGAEDWTASELAVSSGIVIHKTGIVGDNSKLLARDVWKGYGVKYCANNKNNDDDDDDDDDDIGNVTTPCLSGLLSFKSSSDYTKHKQTAT